MYAESLKKFLKSDLRIIEIGSNDGTFLKNFVDSYENVLGFEPSKNVADKAMKQNIPTENIFFNRENVRNFKEYLGNTDLICASNVICHIPDLKNLVEAVDLLLSKSGTFVFEEPYLGSMFERVSYDQIYDEHIYMFSVTSVSKIFEKFNFALVDVFPQITHGGSMRYVIKRKNFKDKSDNVQKTLITERDRKLDKIESCLNFKENCELSKLKIIKKK